MCLGFFGLFLKPGLRIHRTSSDYNAGDETLEAETSISDCKVKSSKISEKKKFERQTCV